MNQPPPDLIELRRAFLTAEAHLHEVGASHPAPTAVARGEAELSDGQREEWQATFDDTRRLAGEIHRHDWWGEVDNRAAAATALNEAAKG
jgi:hypothetical protein